MSQVKANYNGFVGLNGVPVLLHEGDVYDADHALVAARPDLFDEVPEAAPKRPVLGRPKGSSKDSEA